MSNALTIATLSPLSLCKSDIGPAVCPAFVSNFMAQRRISNEIDRPMFSAIVCVCTGKNTEGFVIKREEIYESY